VVNHHGITPDSRKGFGVSFQKQGVIQKGSYCKGQERGGKGGGGGMIGIGADKKRTKKGCWKRHSKFPGRWGLGGKKQEPVVLSRKKRK